MIRNVKFVQVSAVCGVTCYIPSVRMFCGKKRKDVIVDTKWVDWQLVRFTPEYKKEFEYNDSMGLTFAPEIVTDYGPVPEMIVGTTSLRSGDLSNKNFTPNPIFVKFLHDMITKNIHTIKEVQEFVPPGPNDPGTTFCVVDDRKGYYLTDDNRKLIEKILTGDLLGHVTIEDGKIVPASWFPNKLYEILSEDYGLPFFQPWMIQKMKEIVRNTYKSRL